MQTNQLVQRLVDHPNAPLHWHDIDPVAEPGVRQPLSDRRSDITLHARNPEKPAGLDGADATFVPMTVAPYMRDLDDVGRTPALDDLAMFHELAHMAPVLHSSAHHIVEPIDYTVAHRDLRALSLDRLDAVGRPMTGTPAISLRNIEDRVKERHQIIRTVPALRKMSPAGRYEPQMERPSNRAGYRTWRFGGHRQVPGWL